MHVSIDVGMYIRRHTYRQGYIYAFTHTYIHICMHTYIYILTDLHKYVFMHVCICMNNKYVRKI